MNKQKNYRRRQRGMTPITTPRNSPGVAQFSMSEVAQFSVSLDNARRFEIRGIGSSRGIRCIYEPHYDALVRDLLDAAVRVKGSYEAAPDQQPRLVRVEEISITRAASRKLGLDLTCPPAP
jgi:hypothetical protein